VSVASLRDLLRIDHSKIRSNSRLARALASQGVAHTPELSRILALPRRVLDLASYPDLRPLFPGRTCDDPGCGLCSGLEPTLRPIQTAMIYEAGVHRGGFFAAGVGCGKTLVSFLIPSALDSARPLLLVPSQLKSKTIKTDHPVYLRHFPIPQVYDAYRATRPHAGALGVLSYEELSAQRGTGILDALDPDLIVADEAHLLRLRSSSRTKRFLRFLRERRKAGSPVPLVAMTGTPMARTLQDFDHLLDFALGDRTPLPRNHSDLIQWSDCVDERRTAPGALSQLCESLDEPVGVAVRRRIFETPGVISTVELSIDLPIHLEVERPAPPTSVRAALQTIGDTWAWDGEDYDQVLEVNRLQRELAQGFYYRLDWPDGEPDHEWLDARNAWRSCVRSRLQHTSIEGEDSPGLLEGMARRGEWTTPEWEAWASVQDRPEPPRVVVELDGAREWTLGYVREWIDRDPGVPGLIWVDSPVVGGWLQDAGIPYYGQGMNREVNELAQRSDVGTVALSIRAHRTGKNLQAWHRNLVLFPPADPRAWEQLIGRTHRAGQRADHVDLTVWLVGEAAESAWASAQEYSARVEERTGAPQRLLIALRALAGTGE